MEVPAMQPFKSLIPRRATGGGAGYPSCVSFLIGCFAVFLFVGCASVETQTSPVSFGGERLVKPERVLIYDFAVSPEQVQLDEGITRSVSETVRGTEGTPRTQKELELGRRVSRSLTENLVKELGKYGIPAERASGPPPTKSNVHFVKGDFVSIDEGSMTQRMVIGFGMGRSVVRAEGRVYQTTPQGPRLLGLFDTEVKSGRKPGMGPMVGVGAVTGNIVASAAISGGIGVVSESTDVLPFSAGLEGNVQKMAKDLARKAARGWVKRGWLPSDVLD